MSVTAPTPIDALPAVPQRTDTPANFVTKADAWLAAQPNYRVQINNIATNVYNNALDAAASASAAAQAKTDAQAASATAASATTLFATSSSSMSLVAGAYAVTFDQASRTIANGDQWLAIRRSDSTQRMQGTVSGLSGLNFTFTVAAGGIAGSGGPYTDWDFISAAFASTAATGSDVLSATSLLSLVTPAALADASAEVVLVDAATVTPDFAAGRNFSLTLGGNRTIANPTNMKVGQSGHIRLIQDGTGSRTVSWGSFWKRSGGPPSLTTTAGAEDEIAYRVLSSGRIWFAFSKAPS